MVLPDLVPDMQRTTLQATVYSGDRCRRGDAQSLALTTESIPANRIASGVWRL